MKTVLAFEVIFLKVYIFEGLQILNALYYKYVANITFKQFTLVLEFYLKNDEKKEEDDTFLRKKAEEKQNSANVMLSVDGKGTVFPVKLKLQGK